MTQHGDDAFANRAKGRPRRHGVSSQTTILLILALQPACAMVKPLEVNRTSPVAAPPEAVAARVYLVGDAGEWPQLPVLPPLSVKPLSQRSATLDQRVRDAVAAEVRARVLQTLDAPFPAPFVTGLIRDIRESGPLARARMKLLWLGDNAYPAGLPPYPGLRSITQGGGLSEEGEAYVRAATAILLQAEASLRAGASAHMVPGNHDWDQAKSTQGKQRIRDQAELIEDWVSHARANGEQAEVRLVPRDGCAGPEVTKVALDPERREGGAFLHLLAFDTESEMKVSQAGCRGPSLVDAISSATSQDVVLLYAHHPPESYGPHGGHVIKGELQTIRHTFLGRTLGFILSRLARVVTLGKVPTLPLDEDLAHPGYRRMITRLEAALAASKARSNIYAAGHEHSLQVFQGRTPKACTIISGSASKKTLLAGGPRLLFSSWRHGYVVLDFLADGQGVIRIVQMEDGAAKTVARFPLEQCTGGARTDAHAE